MSRFFGGNSDSESSSSEDEDLSDDDQLLTRDSHLAAQQSQAATAHADKSAKASAFMKGGDSDDDDDDKPRVVRSARDKRWDQLDATIADMRNHVKINDWIGITADYEKMNKLILKAKQIVAKEGVPKPYLRALLTLDDALNAALADKATVKKMSSSNAKALNSLKQKTRKHNKNYEAELAAARAEMAEVGGDDADDAADDGGSDDSDSDSSSSDDDAPATGKSAFMKKPAKAAKPKAAPKKAAEAAKPAPPPKQSGPKPIKDYNEAEIDKRLDQILSNRGKRNMDMNESISILQQLADVTKRPSKLVELLGHVIAFSLDKHRSMLSAIPTPVWHQVFVVFRRILRTLVDNPELKIQVIEGSTAAETAQLTTAEVGDGEDEFIDSGVTQMTSNVLSYLERLDDEFYKSLQLQDPHAPAYVERLKDEVPLVNLMQETLAYYDSQSDKTTDALADAARVASRIVEHIYYREQKLFDTAMENATKRKVQLAQLAEAKEAEAAQAEALAAAEESQIAELEAAEDGGESGAESDGSETGGDKVKKEIDSRKVANSLAKEAADATAAHTNFCIPRPMNLADEIGSLSKRIYGHGAPRAKVRTILCAIYHHALHGRYDTARDMLLMSHLGETIHQGDVSTQILYNRALVQLGLCAFSHELVADAHACLNEIASGPRIKELLAQAISSTRYGDRNPEQERQERRRLVPYHMHINLDLVESVHLLCAMLLELPNLAHNAFDPRRRSAAVSKTFRRLLDQYERQVFNGPPENTRDYVMSAALRILEGDWRKAIDTVLAMPSWKLLRDPDSSRAFIRTKLRIEGLRAYVLSSYAHYDSLSLTMLAERFEMPEREVHSIVSKMMLDAEVHASHDQPTNTIVVQRTEPSKLQFLALQFSDKCSQLVEMNERVLDVRTGSYGYKERGFQSEGGYRRPWVERGDREGHRGGFRPWEHRGGGGGRGRGDRDRIEGQGRRF